MTQQKKTTPKKRTASTRKVGRPAKKAAAKTRTLSKSTSDKGSLFRRFARFTVACGLWGALALALILLWYGKDLPDVRQVTEATKRPETIILAADGSVLARYGDIQSEKVQVSELPTYLPQAVISIEDRRFYDHFGVDPIGILRAAYRNMSEGKLVQGGSTITQQLAKNMFLSPERTLKRKVQEAMLAIWLETKFSKDEILTAYLNRVYLGAGTYGIEAASQTYFGHSARKVSLEEAAMLAGLLKAPSSYAPSRHPDRAHARAQIVLDAMVDAGYLSDTERQSTQAVKGSAPTPKRKPGAAGDGLYYADWVYSQIKDYVGKQETDLVVYTAYQPKYQRIAETKLANLISSEGKSYRFSQGAFVLMRPDGAVEALVGGADYRTSQFNRATQAKRQPGSAFKPIIYLAGLQAGLEATTQMLDHPVEIKGYAPKNYGDKYAGNVTLTEGLLKSANSISVQVLDFAGVDTALSLAKKMGIHSKLRRDLTLALGGSEVSLLELTTAYGVLANGGEGIAPWGIKKIIRTDGEVLYERSGSGFGQAADADIVYELNAMMQQVVLNGTGRKAALADREAAGKTGTSQNFRDAWFMGFTANYVGGLWIGNDDSSPMRQITGGGAAAYLWGEIMRDIHEELPIYALPAGYRGEAQILTWKEQHQDRPKEAKPKTEKKGFWSSFFGQNVEVKYTYPGRD